MQYPADLEGAGQALDR